MSIDMCSYLQRYFSDNAKQKEYAEKLGEAFVVTHAFNSETVSDLTRNLSYWIAKPSAVLSKKYSFEKEVLIIYSEHLNNDLRIITGINQILDKPHYRNRIDGYGFILLHNSSDDCLKAILSEAEQSMRIIVPFKLEDIRLYAGLQNEIEKRLGKYIYISNYFDIKSPITDEKLFFGSNRKDVVSLVESKVAMQNECAGVFGLRRTGKTSVLKVVERRLVEKDILVIYIDCRNYELYQKRGMELLEYIARRIENESGKLHSNEKEFFDKIDGVLKNGVKQIVLIIDEIEYISPVREKRSIGTHWAEDYFNFFEVLRSTHQQSNKKFVFIVSGVNSSVVESNRFDKLTNPIYGLITPIYLEPFDQYSTKKMLEKLGRISGVSFEGDDIFSKINTSFGGHPYLIRMATSIVRREKIEHNNTITFEDFICYDSMIRSKIIEPIKDMLFSLMYWYQDEYAVIELLAADNDIMELKDYVNLGYYGIIDKQTMKFTSKYVKDFVINEGPSVKAEVLIIQKTGTDPEIVVDRPDMDKLTKFFSCIGNLESDLRQLVVLILSNEFLFDQKKVAERIIESIKTGEKSRRRSKEEVRNMFFTRKPKDVMLDLYFPELFDIISENWSIFKRVFKEEKKRFNEYGQVLYPLRNNTMHIRNLDEIVIDNALTNISWFSQQVHPIILNSSIS